MDFYSRYQYLKKIYNPGLPSIPINDFNTEIKHVDFNSDFNTNEMLDVNKSYIDTQIIENVKFSYPVFVPSGKKVNDKVIILVHGLNERSWQKHLGWALNLCESTGKSVILFPISYHMNRGPSEWTDPRKMNCMMDVRKIKYPDIQHSTFINLALSERLTSVPQRFFLSGLNYACDLVQLIKDVKTGNHPLFKYGTQIDFFAYSIGVFLVQCMITADPEGLFRNSKYVFFAGGSLFSEMNGISRFIMDNKAFERIHYYYLREMEEAIAKRGEYSQIFEENILGKAFRAMINKNTFREWRDKVIHHFKPNILIIALRDDKVIPLKGIQDLFGKRSNLKVLHFDFPYIHENPFPVHIPEAIGLVEKAFYTVFQHAGKFLART